MWGDKPLCFLFSGVVQQSRECVARPEGIQQVSVIKKVCIIPSVCSRVRVCLEGCASPAVYCKKCLTGWKASSECIVYVESLIVKFCAVLIPISHSVNLDQVILKFQNTPRSPQISVRTLVSFYENNKFSMSKNAPHKIEAPRHENFILRWEKVITFVKC